jgi:hypothetical protein
MQLLMPIDGLCRRYLTQHWTEEERRQFVANLCLASDEASERRAVQQALDRLDAKASGILTHISMMIAAMGVTAISQIVDHDSERFICYLTIGVYLVLAIACLRCMSVTASELAVGKGDRLLAHLEDDLIYRRELYAAINNATTWLTGIVLVLIYFFYFY